MLEMNFVTLLSVLLLAGVLAYRFSFFHKRKLWYLSLQQLFLLVVAPGFLFPAAFNYLQTMAALPAQNSQFVSDKLLINMTLMALLFTYGGLAIHAVTKMMSDHLRKDDTELAEINKFFHLQFSHNLTFAGSLLVLLGFTLLELNHAPLLESPQTIPSSLKGFVLGICFLLGMQNYTKFMGDNYFGKWNDLKFVFVMGWIGFMVLLYGILRLDPQITAYQFLLPTLISFLCMSLLSVFLVVRRLKRGGIRVRLNRKAVDELMTEERA